MGARLGHVLYWLSCIIAVLLLALAAYGWFQDTPAQRPLDESVYIFLAIAAFVVWLIGRACRYVLSGK